MDVVKLHVPPLSFVKEVASADGFDCLVVVTEDVRLDDFPGKNVIYPLLAVDKQIVSGVTIHYISSLPGGKLILCPTGPCNRDFDDVRVFASVLSADYGI